MPGSEYKPIEQIGSPHIDADPENSSYDHELILERAGRFNDGVSWPPRIIAFTLGENENDEITRARLFALKYQKIITIISSIIGLIFSFLLIFPLVFSGSAKTMLLQYCGPNASEPEKCTEDLFNSEMTNFINSFNVLNTGCALYLGYKCVYLFLSFLSISSINWKDLFKSFQKKEIKEEIAEYRLKLAFNVATSLILIALTISYLIVKNSTQEFFNILKASGFPPNNDNITNFSESFFSNFFIGLTLTITQLSDLYKIIRFAFEYLTDPKMFMPSDLTSPLARGVEKLVVPFFSIVQKVEDKISTFKTVKVKMHQDEKLLLPDQNAYRQSVYP